MRSEKKRGGLRSLHTTLLRAYSASRRPVIDVSKQRTSKSEAGSLLPLLLDRYSAEGPQFLDVEVAQSRTSKDFSDRSLWDLLLQLVPTVSAAHLNRSAHRSSLSVEQDLEDALSQLNMSRASSDALTELSALVRLSELHLTQGNWHAAAATLTAADELATKLGAAALRFEILDGFGRALQAIGDVPAAVEAFATARDIALGLDNARAYALVTANEGVARLAMNDVRSGYALLRESVDRLEVDEDTNAAEFATSHAHLGHALVRLNQYDEARLTFSHSLEFARSAGDWPLEAKVLRYLGWVCRAQLLWLDAIGYFEASLAVMRAHGETDETVRETLIALADAHSQLGHQTEADLIRGEAERVFRQ